MTRGFILVLLFAASAQAQQETTVFVEPISAGAQYLHWSPNGLGLGVSANAGRMTGVELSNAPTGHTHNTANAYTLVAYRAGGFQLQASPIGVALVTGNDFRAFYPSAQFGLALARNRLRFGSFVRVIRIAGPNSTATYWSEWIPLRLGLVL